MGCAVTLTTVQEVEVTVAPTLDIRVEITPAVNTTQAQQLAVAVAGVNQTVVVRPVE